MPCNRSCRDESQTYSRRAHWNGVAIRRLWRLPLAQASALGRLSNALWMMARWSLAAIARKPDLVLIGTDPAMSVSIASVWKLLRPRTRVVHWCFDLYPEAALADGLLRPNSSIAALMKTFVTSAYSRCDLLADVGPCMWEKLRSYRPGGRHVTLTPWALSEPAQALPINQAERKLIFGSATLALLYSGTFGRAHSSALLLRLARQLEPHHARLVFSVRGNRVAALKRDAQSVSNVAFVPFAAREKLDARLSAGDIQVVSLRAEWTGTVIPSKFFGALAAGRPVLFAGSPESSIALWIQEHRVGWILTESTLGAVVEKLTEYCANPGSCAQLFEHCHRVYQRHFSKQRIADRWDQELRQLSGLGAGVGRGRY
jgi:glycosyltransferase involved in cell wall biosynthesis